MAKFRYISAMGTARRGTFAIAACITSAHSTSPKAFLMSRPIRAPSGNKVAAARTSEDLPAPYCLSPTACMIRLSAPRTHVPMANFNRASLHRMGRKDSWRSFFQNGLAKAAVHISASHGEIAPCDQTLHHAANARGPSRSLCTHWMWLFLQPLPPGPAAGLRAPSWLPTRRGVIRKRRRCGMAAAASRASYNFLSRSPLKHLVLKGALTPASAAGPGGPPTRMEAQNLVLAVRARSVAACAPIDVRLPCESQYS